MEWGRVRKSKIFWGQRRAGPDSPGLSFRLGKAPRLAACGGGVVQDIEALERNGRAYCPKPARGPQRPAGLFISAPKQTGHFPGPVSRGD